MAGAKDEATRPDRDLRAEALAQALQGKTATLICAQRADDIATALRLIDDDAHPEQVQSAHRSIDHLVQTGRLRPVRMSNRVFFTPTELAAFVDRETEAAPLKKGRGTRQSAPPRKRVDAGNGRP